VDPEAVGVVIKPAEMLAAEAAKTSAFKKALIAGSTKYADLAESLSKKAIAGATKYDTLIGEDVWNRVNKNWWGGLVGEKLGAAGAIGRLVEKGVNYIPSVKIGRYATPAGEDIVKALKYSTNEARKVADSRDQVIRAYRTEGVVPWRGKTGAHFDSMADMLDPNATVELIDKATGKIAVDKAGEVIKTAIWEADDAANGIRTFKPGFKGTIKVKDNLQNAKTLLQVAGEDLNLKYLTEAYKEVPKGRTGVEWYDKVLDKMETTTWTKLGTGDIKAQVEADAKIIARQWNSMSDVKANLAMMRPLEGLLMAHRFGTVLFKAAKVPMNVGSHIIANLGNAVMGAMYGLPIHTAEYRKSMVMANKIARGTMGVEGLRTMFEGDVTLFKTMMLNNPTRFRKAFGTSAADVLDSLTYGKNIQKVPLHEMTMEQLFKASEEGFDALRRQKVKIATEMKLAKMETIDKVKLKTGSESLAKTKAELGGENLLKSDIGSSFTESELDPTDWYDRFKTWVDDKALTNPARLDYQALNVLVNTMPKWYEQIDQTWKMATIDYITRVGLTEAELIKVSRSLVDPIIEKDVFATIIKNGQTYYKLTPLRASEVALEAFMDYSAMPDTVRILRTLPVLGSPFFSFPFAMVSKTGKTLINNPAVFNKVAFLLDEISGTRTPEEKAAMQSKYNQYINSPTMVKLFGMWNTDAKNYIPYLTMNMFNPSNRTYDDSLSGQFLKYSDKFPILQDPLGQVIKDYYLQPWILSMAGSTQIPQGQFGQPIYPAFDADGKPVTVSSAVKAFYAARTAGDAIVPGTLAYLGVLLMGLSPEAINLIPSQKMRTVAFATQGRSSIGKETKENVMQKTIKALSGLSGLPLYTLDTSMPPKNVKTQ